MPTSEPRGLDFALTTINKVVLNQNVWKAVEMMHQEHCLDAGNKIGLCHCAATHNDAHATVSPCVSDYSYIERNMPQ